MEKPCARSSRVSTFITPPGLPGMSGAGPAASAGAATASATDTTRVEASARRRLWLMAREDTPGEATYSTERAPRAVQCRHGPEVDDLQGRAGRLRRGPQLLRRARPDHRAPSVGN